jgi:site-specific recombinase XerD
LNIIIVKLLYSAGLRVGEVVKLKTENLELESNYGWIRGEKEIRIDYSL